MAPQRGSPTISQGAPWSDQITDYDRAHFDLNFRLLDVDAKASPSGRSR
jgi:hypothetical protein